MHLEKYPIVGKGLWVPFILLTVCFALWGAANNMTDLLVTVFREVKTMKAIEASLIQSAFYGAYFIMPIPAAILLKKVSYKSGVVTGLMIYSVGAFLCYPASQADSFTFFLIAFLTFAAGCAMIETCAAPCVLSMGPEETAVQRINFAQALNPVGSVAGIILGKIVILSNLTSDEVKISMADKLVGLGIELDRFKAALVSETIENNTPSEIASATLTAFTKRLNELSPSLQGLDPADKAVKIMDGINGWNVTRGLSVETKAELLKMSQEIYAHQTSDLSNVVYAYAIVAVMALAVGLIILVTKFPKAEPDAVASGSIMASIRRLSKNKNYLFSVVAQFFYVGAQIGVWTYIVPYVMASKLGTIEIFNRTLNFSDASDAWWFYSASLGLFLVSRWITTALMKKFDPAHMMELLAIVAIILSSIAIIVPGWTGVFAVVGISACMSLMFPTIYGLGLSGVGEDRKVGGSGIIMAIVGGAILVPAQAALIDRFSVAISFAVPLICFVVVAIYSRIARKREEELGILHEAA